MFLVIEENPNCDADERVFSESGPHRAVHSVEVNLPSGGAAWCQVTGVDESGKFVPVNAVQIEDSSDGTAILVFGGDWGLRFKAQDSDEAWSLQNKNQWGAPFKVLDESSVRF